LLYSWTKWIQTRLYPPVCLLCGAPGRGVRDLCAGCFADLPWNRAACRRCALPLPTEPGGATPDICGQCISAPLPITRALSPLIYCYPADRLILQLKFGHRLAAGRVLGELLSEYILTAGEPLPEIVVPVPLHRQRLRERGFNQATELARATTRRFNLPLVTNLCQRTRATDAQSTPTGEDRRRNVRGAFTVKRPLTARHIAIVDDVVTTASTVHALAHALQEAGATRIDVWSAARASLNA
jgi:ComF family protein